MTELAILVPVLNRPQNVAPLVESFLAGCPEDSTLHFLLNRDDRVEDAEIDRVLNPRDYPDALYEVRFEHLYCEGTSWPQKINEGYAAFADWADWYLCAADDITFTPGWWEATKELRDDPTIGVIGTNDSATGTGNPRVAAGDHTCHPLIRASYIRDYGTVDQPGLAVFPGYHHSFVDDELVWTAKIRGTWAFCREAVIEHNHPWWKPEEASWDATYEKGQSSFEQDKSLWMQRCRLLGLEPA